MVTQLKWIERKFDFNYPIGVFPCIVERLRGTPARLDEIIGTLPPQILPIQINNGWSIQENVGHLLDLDELHETRLDEFLTNAELLSPADMKNRKTYEAAHNEKPVNVLLTDFRAKRLKFVDRLEGLDEDIVEHTALHPRLNQPMRIIDMAFFTAEHDDHHIARIIGLSKLIEK